jgi:hypothetical protein
LHFLILNRTLFSFFSTSKKVWNIGIKVYKDNSKVDKLKAMTKRLQLGGSLGRTYIRNLIVEQSGHKS